MRLIWILAQGGEAANNTLAIDQVWQSLLEHAGSVFAETSLRGWIILLIGIFAGLLAGKVTQMVLRRMGRRMIENGWQFRGTIFVDAAGPVNLMLITAGLGLGIADIVLGGLQSFVFDVLRLLYIIAVGWFVYNLVDLVDVTLRKYRTRHEGALHDQIIPLIRKTLRIFVVAVFVLFAAENVFGANIGAWLAGLGIAGLAVSLAAQDSIKNLFGSITIFLDKPYAIGDRIMVSGHDGIVENIGFRSTRIRTLIGHVVTIPNANIVHEAVENVTRRPHIRRLLNVTITYDTPPEKVEQAVQILRDLLKDPEVSAAFHDMEKFPPRVFFNDYNDASLNIIVLYWFYPNDWWAYMEHTQTFNMKLLRRFNEAGIDFAFPTQTLHLAGDEKRRLVVQVETQA